MSMRLDRDPTLSVANLTALKDFMPACKRGRTFRNMCSSAMRVLERPPFWPRVTYTTIPTTPSAATTRAITQPVQPERGLGCGSAATCSVGTTTTAAGASA